MLSARAYHSWLRLLAASLFVLLTLSCGHGASPDRERSVSAALAELTALAAPLPSVAARLRPTERGWAARDGATRSPGSGSGELVAELPTAASGELSIGVGSGAALRTRWRLAGASDAALAVDQGRAIYQAALPSTDLVLTAEARSAEILLVLRDAAAPSSFRFDVTLSADLVRVEPERSGGVAFVDERGKKRLGVGKAVAVDAAGTLRDGTVRWSDGALTLALNTEGLVYPIVLDPVIDAIAWRLAVPSLERAGHAMAYDASRKKVVMFGGSTSGAALVSDETWEWDPSTGWTFLRPASRPGGRSGHVMAYDYLRKKVVLFGGESEGGSLLQDTWEWDGTTWTQGFQGPGPVGRRGTAMAGGQGKVLLFGGKVEGAPQPGNDVWTWDGASWTDLSDPQTSPPPRSAHTMAYDVDKGWVVLFGGSDGQGFPLNDLWTWDGSSWTSPQVSGNPPPGRPGYTVAHVPGAGIAMVGGEEDYDVWLLGDFASGWQSAPLPYEVDAYGWRTLAMVPTEQGALWFDGSEYRGTWTTTDGLTWARHAPQAPTFPSARRGAAMAYDAGSTTLLLMGGQDGASYEPLGDTWGWHGDGWSLLSTSGPSPRDGHRLAAYADGVLLFGGYAALPVELGFGESGLQSELGDTWLWKNAGWNQVFVDLGSPSERSEHGMATNVGGAGVLLFGGMGSGVELGDTWVWNGNAWEDRTAGLSKSPSARYGFSMAYDADRDEVVLFGGSSYDTRLDDTWIWDGGSWAAASNSGPSARSSAVMAYDSVRKRVVLTGGTDSGEEGFGETWEWDGATKTWSEVVGAKTPATHSHAMGYDDARRQMALFGGMGELDVSGETWAYDSFKTWPDGVACSDAADCASGFCVDSVCCDTACDGACIACSVDAGSVGANGTCAPVTTGISCDDGDPNTVNDVCTSGVCGGVDLCLDVVCTAQDQCHDAGTCDPGTGACSTPAKADGTSCDDGDQSTHDDVCTDGACGGGVDLCLDVVCTAKDDCHLAGVCDPATGACSSPPCVDDCPAKCVVQACGNGVREGDEACDGADLTTAGGDLAASCESEGHGPGALGCKIDCSGFDVSGCACPATDKPCQYGVRSGDGPCTSVSKPDGSLCPGGECMAGECIGEPPKPPPPPGPGQGVGAGSGAGGNAGHGTGGASAAKAGATDDASADGDGTCAVASPGGDAGWRGAWLAVSALSALALRRRRRAS